jgi:hypothetical protein
VEKNEEEIVQFVEKDKDIDLQRIEKIFKNTQLEN